MRRHRRKKIPINHLKIIGIFSLLLISNIILYVAFIKHYLYDSDILISVTSINNILSMISAIIILGFISTRLPLFRKLGDSSIYEIGYLIIIGILSMVVSYFNRSANTEAIINPFLEMFKVLSVMLIFMIIVTKLRPFKNVLKGRTRKKDLIFCMIVFSILGCIASKYHVYVNGAPANVRCLIIMIGGLIGGPFVGIPSAIIAGGFRFMHGGVTAFPCAISTIISGIVGSLIYVWNDKKFLRGLHSILLVFLFTGFEMLMIVVLTPKAISFPFAQDIYPLMLFASVLGMALFIMIIREEKGNTITYEEFRINEMENTLDGFIDRVDELESEVEELKKEKSD